MEYRYVRVSTKEQNEDRQMVAMREFGVKDSNVILDKQSGRILSVLGTSGWSANSKLEMLS